MSAIPVTARDVITCVLLAIAVITVLASAIGVLAMPGAERKLHFVTPAAVVAPGAVAAAVLVAGGLDYGTGMAWLTVVLLVIMGPFLSHATIRAIRLREEQDKAQAGGSRGGERGCREREATRGADGGRQ